MERVPPVPPGHAHIRVACPSVKVVYKPFSIVAKSVATRLGKTAFDAIWAKVGDSDRPPAPRAEQVSLARVAGAAALEAATMAAIAAAVDQLSARWFHHVFGAWPEKPPE
jgi:hypothetical protein